MGTITDLLPVSRVIYPAATWTSPGNLLEVTTLLSLVLLQSQKFTPTPTPSVPAVDLPFRRLTVSETSWYSQCLALGEGNGTPLQYSCLENPMDGGAWWAAVHGVTKSRIRLNGFTFTFHFHTLEKEMAAHSSVLAWRIPGTGEPGGLLSMGSHRVRHD